jgi:cytochrome c553
MRSEFTEPRRFAKIADQVFSRVCVEINPMKKLVAATLSSVLLVCAGASQAGGDAAAGKTKAAVCAGCHGASGVSANPLWPNLAGQKDAYLVKQMKAFRDGTRSDPMMTPMAKPLSDADIDNLAAYFSSLK